MGLFGFFQESSIISNLTKGSHSKLNGSEGLCIGKTMEEEGTVSGGTWISLLRKGVRKQTKVCFKKK